MPEVRRSGLRLPAPCAVVLIGPSASGKSTWAASRFPATHIVGSDALRAVVGEDERDLRASDAAFELLETIVEHRLARGLTTVIDTTGLDAERRARWVARARAVDLPVFAIVFDAPAEVLKQRNRGRERPVPVKVVDSQLRSLRAQRGSLEAEGFTAVVGAEADLAAVPPALVDTPEAETRQRRAPVGLAFGLQIPDYGFATSKEHLGDELAEVAVAAERVGFESVWVMDHLLQIPFVGAAWLDMLESYTTLAFLAARTTRIRIGAMVTGITYRNVAHLGKIVATLDVLSQGRAECGLGAAWFEHEHDVYGYRFPPAAERLDLLEDAVQLLPLMWGPGAPPFQGRRLQIPEATCYPRPVQGRIPILVGGGGERRTLQIAARHADAVNVTGPREKLARKVAVLTDHARAADRDPDEIRVTHLGTVLVGDSPLHVDELVQRHRGKEAAARYAARVMAGTVTDHVGRFRQLADVGAELCVVSFPDVSVDAVERFGALIETFRDGQM